MSELKNVLFVTTEMRLGGRERVVGEISDGLINNGVNSAIFSVWVRPIYFKLKSSVIFYAEELEKGFEHNFDKDGVVLLKKNIHKNSLYEYLRNFLFLIVRNLFEYKFLQKQRINELIRVIGVQHSDVIVLTDLTITFAPVIKKAYPNLKIVGWLHMDTQAFFYDQYKSFKKELLNAFTFVDTMVTLTSKQKAGYGNYHSNVVAISNPMPDPNFEDFNPNINDNNELLMVTRIDVEHKGLDYLVSILAKVKVEWYLTIVGSGSDEDTSNLRKLIKNNHLESKINLVGAKRGSELDDYYKKGNVFLMTSRYEGFPMTMGEAMANGLPIVSFELDGVKEAVGNDGNYPAILIPEFDIDDFALSIDNLLTNPQQKEIMSRDGLNRVLDFSISKIVQQWRKILF